MTTAEMSPYEEDKWICSHPTPQHANFGGRACCAERCTCHRFRPAPIARNLWGIDQAVILPERPADDCD